LDRFAGRSICPAQSMRIARRSSLNKVLKVLEEQIQILESVGFAESASLLRIAWLDIKRRSSDISIAELEAFSSSISDAASAQDVRARPSPRRSPRRR
jgi:hypothetical protein